MDKKDVFLIIRLSQLHKAKITKIAKSRDKKPSVLAREILFKELKLND